MPDIAKGEQKLSSIKTFGPYSPIRQAENFYFVSGQVGVDPETKQAEMGISGQTHQILKNLKKVLRSDQLTFEHLVKTTIFLADINDYKVVNEIYESYFEKNKPKPARSCVEVSKLPNVANYPLLIEVEAVAYKEQND